MLLLHVDRYWTGQSPGCLQRSGELILPAEYVVHCIHSPSVEKNSWMNGDVQVICSSGTCFSVLCVFLACFVLFFIELWRDLDGWLSPYCWPWQEGFSFSALSKITASSSVSASFDAELIYCSIEPLRSWKLDVICTQGQLWLAGMNSVQRVTCDSCLPCPSLPKRR